MTDIESSGPQRASVPAAQGTPVALAATGPSPLGESDVVQDNAVVASDALGRDKGQGVTSTLPTRQETTTSGFDPADPMNFGRHRRENISTNQMKVEHPDGNKRKLKKYYSRQNKLIDQFLGAEDEERNTVEEDARYKPKIKFAVNASFVVNFCLFVIQMYAAISTGSLSLFATAADAFYGPGIVLRDADHIQACGPAEHLQISSNGICAGLVTLLILLSWASNAFEHVWLLVGKSAPKEFIAKLIYMTMTHDDRMVKVDTQCRAYHAGQHYYVELDIVMGEDTSLRISHNVGQTLQRKLEGLGLVERAFVHGDYEHAHNVHEEHKPLYEKPTPKRSLKDVLLFRKPAMEQGEANASIGQ
ncbi:hypothetical protein N0V85_007170 [Neurospora sp. IMI 360204]|nr:hypothetical protein N0V85_007170 [Neurospora sp. IMI 360204]